jgi:TonB-dependent receptor
MGFTTSFQFKPTDHTLLTLDGLYAKLDVIRQEAQLEAPGFSTAGATGTQAIDVVNATVVNNGVNGLGNQTSTLVAGTFNDVDIRSEARYDDLSTQFTQFSLNGDHSFTDTLKFHAMVGRARSNHDNPISTTLIMDAQDVDGYSYNYQNDSRLPTISYGNANVTAANTWTLAQIRINSVQVDNTVNNGLADLEWQFTDMLSVKGGLQYKEYENSVVTTNRVAAAGGTGNQQSVFPAGTVRTVDGYSKLYTLDGVTTNGSPATWLIPDVQKAYSVLGLGNQAVFPTGIASTLANNYTVDEKDKGVFAQLNFQMEVMGLPVRGNVGVRYVQTDQNSTGYTFANGAPVLNSADSDYSDTLPSLNVATNVTEDFIVRASAAKTVARNSLNFIVPRAAANVSGNAKTLNIGNPNLDPQRANVFDLGFEWYYQPEALLGVALFYKDIGTYVQNISTTGNFAANPLGLPNSVAIQACGPNVDPTACLGGWQFTVPTNTPGGNLKGAELSFQQPFTFLPAPFSNFGALVNYTYVDSQIQYLTIVNGATVVAATQDLISLSKNAANGTLYYDDGTFGARVSVAYRDQFYTTVPGRNLNDFEGTLGTTNIDASSSYKLNDNLTFTFEALNLTDEYSDQYIDTAGNRSVAYHHTGREFLMGARYRF